MAKMSTDELLDAFKEMSLLELSEFVKAFEETFDVTAAAPVAVAAAAPAAGGGDAGGAAEEKDEFDVILEADGGNKIADLESREVLLAKLAGMMKAKQSQAARALGALQTKLEADPSAAASAAPESTETVAVEAATETAEAPAEETAAEAPAEEAETQTPDAPAQDSAEAAETTEG